MTKQNSVPASGAQDLDTLSAELERVTACLNALGDADEQERTELEDRQAWLRLAIDRELLADRRRPTRARAPRGSVPHQVELRNVLLRLDDAHRVDLPMLRVSISRCIEAAGAELLGQDPGATDVPGELAKALVLIGELELVARIGAELHADARRATPDSIDARESEAAQ